MSSKQVFTAFLQSGQNVRRGIRHLCTFSLISQKKYLEVSAHIVRRSACWWQLKKNDNDRWDYYTTGICPEAFPSPLKFPNREETGHLVCLFSFFFFLSSEWTVLPQPYDLLSFCGVYCGHLLTSCCSAIAERRSVFQFRSRSPAFCRGGGGDLMIHPIKYLFTGHEPTSAMRVSEAWEWPQPAHTHTHTHTHTQEPTPRHPWPESSVSAPCDAQHWV